MQVTKHFPAYDNTLWSHPWLAKIGTWPDSGPPMLTFGKRSNAAMVSCIIEAEPGDILRWGQKAKTGTQDEAGKVTFATNGVGWGVVCANGSVHEITMEDARGRRRKAHPEDATAKPVAFGGGKGKGKGKRPVVVRIGATQASVTAQAQAAGIMSPKDAARALLTAVGGDPDQPSEGGGTTTWVDVLIQQAMTHAASQRNERARAAAHAARSASFNMGPLPAGPESEPERIADDTEAQALEDSIAAPLPEPAAPGTHPDGMPLF